MTMDVGARVATEADLIVLAALADAFRVEQRLARGGVLWSDREAPEPGAQPIAFAIDAAEARIGNKLADIGQPGRPELCVVGTINEVVLAFATVALEQLRDGSRIGRIEQLYVDPDARMVSVGEAMMEMIVAWCASHACIGIDAYALPGERLTKNFFESNGFVARLLTMHHRFDLPS